MRSWFPILMLFLSGFAFVPAKVPEMVAVNYAVKFDGEDDFIHFGDVYRDLKVPFTIAAWTNLEPTNFYLAPIFTNRNCVEVYNGFRLVVDRDLISLEYGDGFGQRHPAFRRGKAASPAVQTGQWNHIAAVVNGPNDIALYLNGTDVGGEFTGTSNHPMNSNAPTGFSSCAYFVSNNVVYRLKGMVDDLRLWSRALTPNEIKKTMCTPLPVNEKNLEGYWDFNEGNGKQVLDKSPNKFHGKFEGNPLRVPSSVPCELIVQ